MKSARIREMLQLLNNVQTSIDLGVAPHSNCIGHFDFVRLTRYAISPLNAFCNSKNSDRPDGQRLNLIGGDLFAPYFYGEAMFALSA